jgi:SAM-dependent MidA family methyltransferase
VALPSPTEALAERLRRRIADEGPLPFSAFMEAALYDAEGGFYATGGMAGRRGDFLTSPEVGPLFGAVLARALDAWWIELGRPDPFVVIEGGAGPGTLARAVALAAPQCAVALVHVLVERSPAQRALHGAHMAAWAGEPDRAELERLVTRPRHGVGPVVVSSADLPGAAAAGVVVANELLDNVPFDIVRRSGAVGVDAEELRIAVAAGGFEPVVVPVGESPATTLALAALDRTVWVPRQTRAAEWVAAAQGTLGEGRVVAIDYARTDASLSADDEMGWLRTFRGHERGGDPFDDPGTQDITSDLALDQLLRARPGATVSTQVAFLVDHGVDHLVEEGRRIWHERAHLGDLEALRGRSRVREAEALLDPDGLGGFVVLDWPVTT